MQQSHGLFATAKLLVKIMDLVGVSSAHGDSRCCFGINCCNDETDRNWPIRNADFRISGRLAVCWSDRRTAHMLPVQTSPLGYSPVLPRILRLAHPGSCAASY